MTNFWGKGMQTGAQMVLFGTKPTTGMTSAQRRLYRRKYRFQAAQAEQFLWEEVVAPIVAGVVLGYAVLALGATATAVIRTAMFMHSLRLALTGQEQTVPLAFQLAFFAVTAPVPTPSAPGIQERGVESLGDVLYMGAWSWIKWASFPFRVGFTWSTTGMIPVTPVPLPLP